ncbi:MAG: hypothetical protein ACOVRN_13190 [Flavobacterium sp.]
MLLTNDLMILVALGAACGLYAFVAFCIQKLSVNKKEQMLSKYSELRRQSLTLQEVVSNYLLADDADKKLLSGELTCADLYRQLKSNHVYNLSDKYLSKVKKSNNLLFLNKAERKLYEQEERLNNAQRLISSVSR